MRCERGLRILHLFAAGGLAVMVSAQAPSCSLFKHGTFTIQGDHPGEETRLVRHGNKQKETAPNGHKAHYRVRWVDDCTYQLYDRKVTLGEDPRPGTATDTLNREGELFSFTVEDEKAVSKAPTVDFGASKASPAK